MSEDKQVKKLARQMFDKLYGEKIKAKDTEIARLRAALEKIDGLVNSRMDLPRDQALQIVVATIGQIALEALNPKGAAPK